MVGFAALRDARLGSLDDAAQAWAKLAWNLEDVSKGLEGMRNQGLAGWQGDDADAARIQIDTLYQKAEVAAKTVAGVGKVLTAAREKFVRGQQTLQQGISRAEDLKIRVGEDGSLTPPELDSKDPEGERRLQVAMLSIRAQLERALRMANEADEEIVGALSSLTSAIVNDPASAMNDAEKARQNAARAFWSTNPNDVPGRRSLAEIVDKYQVSRDPEGMALYPGRTSLAKWLSDLQGKKPTEMTAGERKLLEDLEDRGLINVKRAADAKDTAWAVVPIKEGNQDGHGDAFRHAYWNSMMARDLGQDWTRDFGIAHERISKPNPGPREAMDLYNNEVGRQIAKEHPNASNEELAKHVEKAVHEGRMVVIDRDGQLAWSDTAPLGQTMAMDDVSELPEYGHGRSPEDVGK